MILEVENLRFHYPNRKTIFHDVSFSLNEGEIMTILGTNGAGKSTLLNCIANLYKPAAGRIWLNGQDMASMKLTDIAKIIGYVPQNHYPAYAYSVIDFVVMGRTPYIGPLSNPAKEDYRIAEEALEALGISHLAGSIYTEISGGERQLVTIAKAIAQQPRIILLDEPTAHLDFGNQLRMISLIQQLAQAGFSVIFTTHMPDHVLQLGGKTGILNSMGKLIFGDSAAVLSDQVLSELYQIDLKICYIEEANKKMCVPLAKKAALPS